MIEKFFPLNSNCSAQRIMKALGQHIRFARLRRRLSTEQVAEHADTSRLVEKGPGGILNSKNEFEE